MEVDRGTKGDCFSNGGVKLETQYLECAGCLELRDKIIKTDDICANLKLDIGKKKCIIEWLEDKLGIVELRKRKSEDEVQMLKQRNEELEIKEKQDANEIKVLECEMKKAESEVEIWKVKCKELEIKVMEFEKRLSAGMKISPFGGLLHGFSVAGEAESKPNEDEDLLGNPPSNPPFKKHSHLLDKLLGKTSQIDGLLHRIRVIGGSAASPTAAEAENKANDVKDVLGTPLISTAFKQYSDSEGCKGSLQCEVTSTVRKCLDFPAEEITHKNISPSTPSLTRIDISDSDDDLNTGRKHSADLHCKIQNKIRSSCTGLWVTLNEKEPTLKDGYKAVVKHEMNEEEVNCNIVGQPYLRMPKRRNVMKGNAYALSSDSDTDDNIPISRLRSINQLKHGSDTVMKSRYVDGSCFRDKPRKQSCGIALTEFLPDGDSKGDIKKSMKELQESSSKGVESCKSLANHCSKQSSMIHKNKEERFSPS